METNHRSDALTTQEVLEKVLSGAVVKTSLPLGRQLPLAFLAGLYIGLGGLFATLFLSDASLSFAVQRFGAGAVFSLGLSLVLVAGAELYTGNTMIAASAADGRITWGATLLNWVRVWLGNALGALTLVALVAFAHTADLGPMAQGMLGVAAGKLSAGWFTIFVKGILCNLLVCLGVWMGYAGRSVADKVLGVLLPVSAFVALGFEHCVANLYFLPLSMVLSASGYVADGIDPALFTWANVAKNLTAATLGNTVAGVSLAMLYRAACAKR